MNQLFKQLRTFLGSQTMFTCNICKQITLYLYISTCKHTDINCSYLLHVKIVWDPKNVHSCLNSWFIVKAWWWPNRVETCKEPLWLLSVHINTSWWRALKKSSKGKAVPLQAWSGPQCSRTLTFPDFLTTAQEGGKVVSLMHRPHLPPGNTPGTHFCWRLSRPQGHRAIRRIYVNEKFHDTICDRTKKSSMYCIVFCMYKLCCSMYCLCCSMYCTTATGCQPNCS
jgi:hypothetical protein